MCYFIVEGTLLAPGAKDNNEEVTVVLAVVVPLIILIILIIIIIGLLRSVNCNGLNTLHILCHKI